MEVGKYSNSVNIAMQKTEVNATLKDEKTGQELEVNIKYFDFQMSAKAEFEKNFGAQNDIFSLANKMDTLNFHVSLDDLRSLGYEGKPIAELSKDEAKDLIGEDGFFGVTNTSNRVADFVLMGAGDDIEKLRQGREGVIRGFNEAEQIWGEKLPDISYQTLEKTLEKIDKRIEELGYNVLDITS
jgi:hypothetical protein